MRNRYSLFAFAGVLLFTGGSHAGWAQCPGPCQALNLGQPNSTAAELTVNGCGGIGTTNTHSIHLQSVFSQYLSAVDSVSLSVTGDLTIEAWIMLASQPQAGTSFPISGKWWNPVDGLLSYLFQYTAPGSTAPAGLSFTISSSGLVPALPCQTPSGCFATHPLSISNWYHVAVVYTAAAGSAQLYVGDQSTADSIIGTVSGLPTSIFNNAGRFEIGRSDLGSGLPGSVEFFDGLIDDIRVWNTTRTSSQLNAGKSVELTGGEPGLQGYWKLNNSLSDATANGNTLSNHGGLFAMAVPFGGGPAMCGGPFVLTVSSGGPLTLNWSGPPNMPLVLGSGGLAPSNANFGCRGILDIGPLPAVEIVAGGPWPGLLNSLFWLDSTGGASQSFTVPFPTGLQFNLQGAVLQPPGPGTCAGDLVLTAAFNVTVL